jgi:hypothetical protein
MERRLAIAGKIIMLNATVRYLEEHPPPAGSDVWRRLKEEADRLTDELRPLVAQARRRKRKGCNRGRNE